MVHRRGRAGAGIYHEVIALALDLLRDHRSGDLEAAWFDPNLLDELAIDPRAYDFNHPVNKRPNYHFGQWDPHHLDGQGRYRRFVLQQVTLDALLERVATVQRPAARGTAVRSGGRTGGHDLDGLGHQRRQSAAHDSSTTLVDAVAADRRLSRRLLSSTFPRLSGPHAATAGGETAALHQPFAAARQHLNAQLARRRALQLQHVHLALLFARLGFPEAAERQSKIVPAVSARMICQIHCLMTAAHRAADRGRPADGVSFLAQIEDLLHRGIECGAIVDPWNILGFGGQFSLFPAVENSIPDSRVDELLEMMERLFQDARPAVASGRRERRCRSAWPVAAGFSASGRMVGPIRDRGGVGHAMGFGPRSSPAARGVLPMRLSAWHRAGAAGAI